MSTTEKIKGFLEICTGVFAVMAIVITAIQFVFGVSLFKDYSADMADNFFQNATPLVIEYEEGSPEIRNAIASRDNAAFEAATIRFVEEKKIQGKVIVAMSFAESLIQCRKSFF